MKTAIIITFIITAITYASSKLLVSYIANDAEELIRIKFNLPSVKAGIAGLLRVCYYIEVIVLIVLILIFVL